MKKMLSILFLAITLLTAEAQNQLDALFEDIQFEAKVAGDTGLFFTSKSVDFVQVQSTITDSVQFGIVVYKPEKPSPILLVSHGWHMSVRPPENIENPYPGFLTIQVDMRGRKYSSGRQDCNGYELYDFYDAYHYAIKQYSEYISENDQLYYVGGSGGGGNGLALSGKFPDLFRSAVILAPMSDYALWFEQDSVLGEFRDEMIPWIGSTPMENAEAYRSRSGITTLGNVLTPTYIIHGSTDIRVPVTHSRNYAQVGAKLGKPINFLELGNVGTTAHWGNITTEQEALKADMLSRGLTEHPAPVLQPVGELIVAGYVVTKHFSVFLYSIDEVGKISYDLGSKSIEFIRGSGKVTWYEK